MRLFSLKRLTSGHACAEVSNITAHAHDGFLSLTFIPQRSTGEKKLLPELSPERGFFGLYVSQLGFTDNLESKGEDIN